ncbi:CoA ester lyase [Lentzea sp. NPDC051838]|uniref:HpcH/HpaI aldolase/citrate lyase family protein n=1 Tax=Lentzea sp. NPDC051838 TaxID=3154849 RepID=UPI00342F21D6
MKATYLSRTLMVTSALKIDRFEKGQHSGADINLIDLEDAVPAADKQLAREELAKLRPEQVHGTLGVRINSVHTRDGLADLLTILDSEVEPDLVVVPKVESPQHIRLVDEILTKADRSCHLWALIETPRGVADAMAIGAASPRLTALTFGLADFAAEMGATLAWDGMLSARVQVVMAARASGLVAVDAPTFDLSDNKMLELEARKAADIGYSGKIVVHPQQIAVVNDVFSPSPDAVEWARDVVRSFEQTDGGIRVVDGSMVGPPFLRKALAILELQERR